MDDANIYDARRTTVKPGFRFSGIKKPKPKPKPKPKKKNPKYFYPSILLRFHTEEERQIVKDAAWREKKSVNQWLLEAAQEKLNQAIQGAESCPKEPGQADCSNNCKGC